MMSFSKHVLVATFFWGAQGAFADVDGSQDHPLTGRYEGSEITGYDFQEFDVHRVFAGEYLSDIEGIVTQIAYRLPEDISIAAARRNFQKRLEDQGYEAVFACSKKAASDPCNRDIAYGVGQLPLPKMMVDSFDFSYDLYRSPGAGNITVALLTSQSNGRTFLQATVVEADELEIKMVDAAQISDELTAEGHIALYGILFDTDSASLKPESEATLVELGSYLTQNSDVSILIVGHTDNQGALAYNTDLSKRRAGAVRDHLVSKQGIGADRLQAEGVGYLAPVATNATAEGRALNRRVEIVPN